ncbi:hypothetical protein AC579_2589 [Pseudocercospora musae]|uniref:Uncharacterized protein n=1 Tax=Pseudocercospora musae TaxID=113226 RepID=A0A139IEX7_9PEZI|nr:hypothetical protein AC579_2589 [Pseudocercospora musae]
MVPSTITQFEYDRMTTEGQAQIDGVFKDICSKSPSKLLSYDQDHHKRTQRPRLYFPDKPISSPSAGNLRGDGRLAALPDIRDSSSPTSRALYTTINTATMPLIRTPNFELAKQALGLEIKQPPLSPDEEHLIKALVSRKNVVDEHMATARALEAEYLEKLNLVTPRTTLCLLAQWLANIAKYINRNSDAPLFERHILREVGNLRIAAETIQPFDTRKSPSITIGAPEQWKTVIKGPVIGGKLNPALVKWVFKRTRPYLPHVAAECVIHRTVFEMAVETERTLMGMLTEEDVLQEDEVD